MLSWPGAPNSGTNLKGKIVARQAPDSQQPQGEGGHTAGDLMLGLGAEPPG